MTPEKHIDNLYYRITDPENTLNGKPLPFSTTLLFKVCDNDGAKFDEAIRLINLFGVAAFNLGAEIAKKEMEAADPAPKASPNPLDYKDEALASALIELEAETDDQLWERWKSPMCFICDHGGVCTCTLAGRVLVARGKIVKDKYGKAVEPIRIENLEKKK